MSAASSSVGGRAWTWSLRHGALVAALFGLVVSFAGISSHSLWSPDEPREAGMAREMALRDFPALPTLAGEPFLEKPPLYFWCAGLSWKLLGAGDSARPEDARRNVAAVRVPAALFGALAILFAWRIARRCGGRRVALFATVVVASFSTWWSVGHRAVNDVLLLAAVAAAHDASLTAIDAARRGRRSLGWIAAGVATGVAFFTKGIVGPVLAVGPTVVALAAQRDWATLKAATGRLALWCTLGVAAFALPWGLALARHDRNGWRQFYDLVVGQALDRTTGEKSVGAHSHDFWFYLPNGLKTLAPWCVLLPAALWSAATRRRWARRPLRDAGLMFLGGVLLLSIPSGKRTTYLLPLLPLAAPFAADWLARLRFADRVGRATLRLLAGAAVVAAIGAGLGLVWIDRLPDHRAVDAIERAGWRPISTVALVALVVAALWSARLLVRTRAATFRGATRELALFVAVALVASHAVGRPYLDPAHDMEKAARDVAVAVPADEPGIVFWNASETVRAVVPFFTRRNVEHPRTAHPATELAARGFHHLVVLDDGPGVDAMPESLTKRLHKVATTAAIDGFPSTVYRIE
jgi:4-amino-4-deoxy-L-arabinose transferase-like glycosyltransferase